MTDSDYVPFLINDRSSALLHLIDAFQFTESELSDVYDGVFNRMKEHFAPNNTDKSTTPIDVRAVREYVANLKEQAANQEYVEDYVDNIPESQVDDQSFKDVPLGKWVPIPALIDRFGGHQHDDGHYVDDFE